MNAFTGQVSWPPHAFATDVPGGSALQTFFSASPLALRLDFYAFPKGNAAGDVFRSRFRIGVVPSGIPTLFAVNDHGVILRDALPWTSRFMTARLEKILSDIFYWEVVISFDDFGPTGFRDYFSVP
jgi:hypothetical protein